MFFRYVNSNQKKQNRGKNIITNDFIVVYVDCEKYVIDTLVISMKLKGETAVSYSNLSLEHESIELLDFGEKHVEKRPHFVVHLFVVIHREKNH